MNPGPSDAPTRLEPEAHAWLTDPRVHRVMDALDAGAPDASRFVGGCVRNALRGAPVDDIDIATRLEPTAVAAALEAAGVKVVPTGVAHGTITAVVDGTAFEITTLRRDVETDGRNATIAFADTFEEDARRRDFRLNAIYCARDGALFDPEGGIADALAGQVRFIGDPVTRLREDRLRILRFFRFNAWYASGEPDADGLAACAAEARGLPRLSVERVWKELKKLLAAPNPVRALNAMALSGVLEQVLPEAIALELISALVDLEADQGWSPPDPLLRVCALAPRTVFVTERLRRRLKLSKAEAGRLTAWANLPVNPRLVIDADEDEQNRVLYTHDQQAILDRGRLAWAIDRARGEARPDAVWRAFLERAETWERPEFPLTGEDLLSRGVPKGPHLGATMKALEQLWAKGGFRADRAQLLAALEAMRG